MANENQESLRGSTEIDQRTIDFFQTERFEDALKRMAKICYGMCWRYHTPYDLASRATNLALSSFCLFMGVQHSLELEAMIRLSMEEAFYIYYTKTGREREQPMGEEALKFQQVEAKRT